MTRTPVFVSTISREPMGLDVLLILVARGFTEHEISSVRVSLDDLVAEVNAQVA